MRAALFLAAGLTAASPLSAAPAPAVSWGKAGIGFDQYRDDAVACGRAGHYRDVSQTEAAEVFQRATSQLERNEANRSMDLSPGRQIDIAAASARIVEGTRPEKRLREVRAYLEEEVFACLRARGYRPFQLTEAQSAALKTQRRGSRARHEFLHRLASDPETLARQGM